MKLKRKFFLLVVWVVSILACKDDKKIKDEINSIPLTVEVKRFDREFAEATTADIPKLKAKYPYLFPEQYPDSIWQVKLNDTIQQELLAEVDSTFGDFKKEKSDLTLLFKHIKHYFSAFEPPKVITLTSEVQYESRVVLTDTLLLLGLDNYLGADHKFYGGFSAYIAKELDKRYLTSDVASAFAKTINRYPRNRSFLSRMVYYGKELYLKDILLPITSDDQRINYTPEELGWARANEEQIWRYFIERELLYSTDSKLDRRFLDPAPFSKFQLELDSESPGRLGRYLGWQIVRAFAEKNPDVALVELLDMPADEIFKKSNYKPQK
ncbi:gliding motility lipoprotein GldB [uncultured Croceitalea sp.]|uniref:gliding motility lipoprotein GldB n=1 Tax=uncultured Croceitalea sp. TaxID=1798908 RepID=UPI0033064B5A